MIYRLDYCNAQGDELRLDIQYGSNTVINIEGTGNPFTLNYKGDKDDKRLNFLTSSADISLFETEDFNIDMLKTSSETAISVKYYVNSNLFWQGYVIPDFFSKEIAGTPIINMVASDRLSTLKSVSLASDTLPSMITFRELAIKCLRKTGLSLPLKTVANFSNGTGSATDGFFTSKVLTQRLSDTKGRNISCYDILDSILTASGSKLMQRGGEWVIINKDQHERGVGTAFNTPTTNITPTGSHAWSEVVHNFSDINVGGRRTIIPVASSVGVYQEFGGSNIYPENYNFSDALTGWTAINGFVAGINNKEVIGYNLSSGNFLPIYGNDVETNSVINNNASFSDSDSPYLKSENIGVSYPDNDNVNVNVTVEVNATGVGSYITNSFVEFAIIATNTVTLKQLSLSNNGVFETMTADEPHLHRIKFPTISSFYNASTGSLKVEGALIAGDENLGDYDIHVRIYGSGQSRTSFINSTTIKYSVGGDIPRGNLYKTAQGSNFTKQHDIETTIFGDYIRGGVNGYFYNYPIDDTSSIYNASNELTSLWTTPTAPHDSSEQPLLLHIARQKARMFSIAHDLLDVSLDIDNFDPLKIFVDCFGRRYVVVASEYDLLRSRARVTVEQIAFDSTIFKQDFIYSYFGEGEKGISSVGGISGGGGGGGTGGGLTPEQLEILSWWKKDPDRENTIFTEMNAYSKLELSAYGVGEGGGGGGGGIIETVYGYSNLGQTFNNNVLTDTFNAYTINQINTRLVAVENDSGNLEIGGRNLIVRSKEQEGLIINLNGVISPLAGNSLSDYIEIDSTSEYTFQKESLSADNFFRLGWYDENKVFIDRVADNRNLFTRTFPLNVKYIRSSYPTDSKVKIEKGNKPTDWTPAPEDQVSDWNTTDVNSFSFIKNKPTTLSGYGITDATQRATKGGDRNSMMSLDTRDVDEIPNTDRATGMWLDFKSSSAIGLTGLGQGEFSGLLTILPYGDATGNNTSGGRIALSNGNLFAQKANFTYYSNWNKLAFITDNVASATKLQTPRTIWGQSFDGTGNVTGALSGATTIAASISVTTPKVIFNAAGWSMEQVGNELQMKHNNVLKMRFTSAGSIVATEEITAFG